MSIGEFLSYLADEKHVSGSTQNQALQAILYLYKHILQTEIRLMAQLCYGSGLRLMECVWLRIKDVDLPSQRITVRDTKSNRNRHTILPSTLVAPLSQHIERITPLHQSDIANGIHVHLPDAICATTFTLPRCKKNFIAPSNTPRQASASPPAFTCCAMRLQRT